MKNNVVRTLLALAAIALATLAPIRADAAGCSTAAGRE